MRGRRVARAALATAIVGATLGLTAAPAAADPVPPPGWNSPAGGWVQFQLDSYDLSPGNTVTLSRSFGPGDLLTAFSNWSDPAVLNGPQGWPTVFSAGGITLERIDHCDYTNSSCGYRFLSGQGEFWVAASDVDANGNPINDPFGAPHGTVTTPPPTTTPTTPPPNPGQVVGNVTFTPGTGGAPGTASFNATGSMLPGGVTPSGYRWTLQNLAGGAPQSFDCASTTCAPPAHITLDPGATYDVTLTLIDANGVPGTPSSTALLAVPAAQAPADPGPAPPSGGGGGLPAGGGGGFPGVFARPVSRAPASLTGGTGEAFPTVVWLWRPEWFQGNANALPQTAGEPEVKGKTAVVIADSPAPTDTNAAPWLAGLGAFGLIGAGFVINRWLRWRAAHL